ncbi:MAG: hypothetical protein ABIM88_07330 [candidate division WOR-3 bacterium]
MAFGFLMRDSIYILHLVGERDALGSELAIFTRGKRVQCGWGRASFRAEDDPYGRETRERAIAITPPLSEEPRWVERAGRAFAVKEVRRFSGFGTDHWELLLEEYNGRFEIR